MKKKSLLETNPYLKDPIMRQKLIHRSMVTSTAIEGVRIKSPLKIRRPVKKKV